MSVSRSSGCTACQAASKSNPSGACSSTPPRSTTIRWSMPSSPSARSAKASSVTRIRAPASSTWYWICSDVYVL